MKHNKITSDDRDRIKENLAFIAANPTSNHLNWVEEVKAEARAFGLLPAIGPEVGIACRPGIDSRIIYGGDMDDVF